jgi:two-component system, chemotaxis family, chemotaxis protein CheY
MSLTVMVVDDSMIMSQKLAVILRELGHQVVRVCKDGSEAIRDYPLVKPDLVTMDITMPGIDGIDAMTGIMASNPDARVIMVTSHGQEAMVVRALDAGAVGYVLKPVTKERLSAMIERSRAHIRFKDAGNPSHDNNLKPRKPDELACQDSDHLIVEAK